MISRDFLNEIVNRLDITSAAGRSTVEQLLIMAPTSYDYDELFDYVAESYYGIVQSCAETGAAIGASSYDAFREIELGEALGAETVSAYDEATTVSAVQSYVKQSCDEKDLSILSSELGRFIDTAVMKSFSNTMDYNGFKDPVEVRYARVPSGPKPCAFCRAMAGHGFVYTSRKAAGDMGGRFNEYHDFCRCVIVPNFDPKGNPITVEGYDPESYAEEWRETRQTFGSGRNTGQGRFSGRNVKMTPTGKVSKAMPKIDTPLLSKTPDPAELPASVYGGKWNQKDEMQTFLKTLFKDDEYIGTCSEFYTKNGRRVPTAGLFQRTSGQVNNVLNRTNNVASAVGRYRKADGAFIRINPLDGKGVSDANVSRFAYALIEADTGSLEQQYGFIKALNLPTAAITTSGSKSVHAVVRIDAANLLEYQERVSLLHAECKAAGYAVDAATKNPSRYMRIPGVVRGEGRQALVSINEGAKSWDDWLSWCATQRQ